MVNKVAAVEVLKAMQEAVKEHDEAAYESITATLASYDEVCPSWPSMPIGLF